jgi:uncharacterized LabA/DUF88 family protein
MRGQTGDSRPESYVFIDGNCLEMTLKRVSERHFGGARVGVSYASLKAGHRKAYYYDAIPVREWEEPADDYEARTADKRAELSAIAREDGYHVRTGDAQARKRRGREQKMVDVQLAVDMMAFAHQGVFTRATLITGDLDFKPLVDALVQMGIDVTLYYPVGETNADLIEAADRSVPIDIRYVENLLSNEFQKSFPIPQASFVYRGGKPNMPPFFEWDDAKFGRVMLGRNSEGFELLSSEAETTPQHALFVRFQQLTLARTYIEDMFGLRIPDDVPGFPLTA